MSGKAIFGRVLFHSMVFPCFISLGCATLLISSSLYQTKNEHSIRETDCLVYKRGRRVNSHGFAMPIYALNGISLSMADLIAFLLNLHLTDLNVDMIRSI